MKKISFLLLSVALFGFLNKPEIKQYIAPYTKQIIEAVQTVTESLEAPKEKAVVYNSDDSCKIQYAINGTVTDSTLNILGSFVRPIKIYKPANFRNSKRYKVILVQYGAGEGNYPSDPTSDMNLYGPHYYINSGTDMYFNNAITGIPDSIVVIGIQMGAPAVAGASVSFIDIVRSIGYIDTTGIICTGYSFGGQSWENAVITSAANARKVLAIVNFQGVVCDDQSKMGSIYAANGGKWFGIEGAGDDRDMDVTAAYMNAVVPGSAIRKLITNSGDPMYNHSGWNWGYDTSRSFSELGGMNVYRWALSQAPITYLPPTANAGADQIITYPGATSKVLSGSGSSFGSTITSYSWTQVSGPNTASLSGASTATLTASSLVPGLYAFRLTVTDATSATAYDDMILNVSKGTSSNLISLRTDMLYDLSGRKDKSILGLFDGSTSTKLDANGVSDAFALPFRAFIVLDSVYQKMKLSYYNNFTSGGGGFTVNVYDSSKTFKNTYRADASGATVWLDRDISHDSVRFVEVLAPTSQDLNAGIFELRLYGDAVAAAAPIFTPQTITPLPDPGIHGNGINIIDDRLPAYVAGHTSDTVALLIAKNFRTYYEGSRTNHYPETWDSSLVHGVFDMARFGSDHFNTRVFQPMRRWGTKMQSMFIGGDIKYLTFSAASTSNNTYNTTANSKKGIEPGADSTLPSSWAGNARKAKTYASLFGTNTTPTPRLNVTGGNAAYGQGGLSVVEAWNEDTKDWLGNTGFHSPTVLMAKLKPLYDSVKLADPNMPVYLGAMTFMDTTVWKALVFLNFWLYGRTKFPADGICMNLYMNSLKDGQPGSGTGLSPEKWQLTKRDSGLQRMLNRIMPNIPISVTETGYASYSGSPFYAAGIGSKTSAEVCADLTLRAKALFKTSPLLGSIFYYAFFEDGSGSFNSMAATAQTFTGPGGSYSGNTIYPVGYALMNELSAEAGYNFRSKFDQFGDSTGTSVTVKDHATDPTKKLYTIWRGTSTGSTASVNISVPGATSATLKTPRYDQYTPSTSTPTISSGSITITASETPQWLEVTFATPTINLSIIPGVRVNWVPQ